MKPLKHVRFIVVHCAESKKTQDLTTDTLYKWHVIENGWDDIGYHYLIKDDGSRHECRSLEYRGAHERKINSLSIGICLEGGYGGRNDYTASQLQQLRSTILELQGKYPAAAVVGHNNFRTDKTCPNFNVPKWWTTGHVEDI
jgi:N-acetylmuramoyl-L-alanine amidase